MASDNQPVYTMAGTARGTMLNALTDARHAIRNAMAALDETQPHSRDYINHSDYKKDCEIYKKRFALLDELYNSLSDDMERLI